MVHMLYLENNPEHIELFLQQAAAHGFTAATAGSLEEALVRYQQKTAQVICVGTQFPHHAAQALHERTSEQTSHFYWSSPLGATTSAPKVKRLHRFMQTIKQDQESSSSLVQAEIPKHDFYDFIGRSEAMLKLYEEIRKVAKTDVPVLLIGESGTGKDLAAKAIHHHSSRRQHSYMPINCAAISMQIMESELFGHEKGSFTGADRDRQGYFAAAHEGTLFLDEITEMPIEAQTKLLRVLEQGEYFRVGGDAISHCNFRLIAATNRDPAQAISEQRLREDLYYRISVFPIYIPPLRERGDDIELLARTFLSAFNQSHSKHKELSSASLKHIKHYPWPGNVRELYNMVLRAYIISDEQEIELFPELEQEV